MTADRAKPNQLPTVSRVLQLYLYNQVFKKLLSTYEPKPDVKVASQDQIIESLLSLDNMKIAYDAIKLLELVNKLTLKA